MKKNSINGETSNFLRVEIKVFLQKVDNCISSPLIRYKIPTFSIKRLKTKLQAWLLRNIWAAFEIVRGPALLFWQLENVLKTFHDKQGYTMLGFNCVKGSFFRGFFNRNQNQNMEWVVSPTVKANFFFFLRKVIYIIMFIINPTQTMAGFNTEIYLKFLISSKIIQV